MTAPPLPRPCLLQDDNVTPQTRTPWGGTRLARHYKRHLGWPVDRVVGESWEISVEPSFPSRLAHHPATLADAIAAHPRAWLGAQFAAQAPQLTLLVKLLDAAHALSVQVHPAPDDPALTDDESGKPEGWIVLDAAPGAGLYLGFRDGVRRADVAACLADAGPLDTLLNFVPVQPGDAFTITAGTVHAIGAGVTLLEPQHVTPGRRGVTYRFWDWNRRYDPQGRRDPNGQPRPLHTARSLAVTAWDAPRGDAFVAQCRATPTSLTAPNGLTRAEVLRMPWFRAERWTGSGAHTLPTDDTFTGLTCVRGTLTLHTDAHPTPLTLRTGQSAALPASAAHAALDLDDADVFITQPLAPSV